MIVLDTSVLVESLSEGGALQEEFRGLLKSGEAMAVPSLVLYEWLRGPRTRRELETRQALFPDFGILPFGPEEAALAAELWQQVRRARPRSMDLAIAGCALYHQARLWTLNVADFDDIPGLRLHAMLD